MSDLNKLVQAAEIEKVNPNQRPLIEDRVNFWRNTAEGFGPICCFFTRPKYMVGAYDHEGHIDLARFVMAECENEVQVIGCSRGCVPLFERGQNYGSKLCEPCVKAAEEYLINP